MIPSVTENDMCYLGMLGGTVCYDLLNPTEQCHARIIAHLARNLKVLADGIGKSAIFEGWELDEADLEAIRLADSIVIPEEGT